MFGYIRKKLEKRSLKKTFREYPYRICQFTLPREGLVEYAQWEHPFETEKKIGQEEVNFLKKFIRAGDLVLDIGAHTGDTTIPMALAAGKSGLVLALEPNKYVFKILLRNSKLNIQSTNIQPLNFAATEENTRLTFNYSDASFCNGGFLSRLKNKKHNHGYTLEVEGKNLQEYLFQNFEIHLPRLSYMKIDAEGYDKEIIKTLRRVLVEYKPTVITECYKRLSQSERTEFYQLLIGLGYCLYRLNGFDLRQLIPIKNAADMRVKKHFDILAIHNDKVNDLNLMQ